MATTRSPFTYDELEHERLTGLFERTGQVDVVLTRKRALILDAFLRNDRRLRGYEAANSSGWRVMASFSTAAFLTARIYLFHRRLYELLPLVALHEPRVELRESADDGCVMTFSRPEGAAEHSTDTDVGA